MSRTSSSQKRHPLRAVLIVAALVGGTLVSFMPRIAGAAAAPTVNYVSPGNGYGDGMWRIRVTISGSGFTRGSWVDFGRYKALNVRYGDSHSIAVSAPPHAYGRVYVRVHTPNGVSRVTSASYFTYSVPLRG